MGVSSQLDLLTEVHDFMTHHEFEEARPHDAGAALSLSYGKFVYVVVYWNNAISSCVLCRSAASWHVVSFFM